MSTIGLAHTIIAFLALALGAIVLRRPKGGRWHRSLGHLYVNAMVALNVTGLLITDLFGGFGPFHWMALVSLIVLMMGMLAVLLRRPVGSWRAVHSGYMAGSYVGLVAAAGAEVGARVPGVPFAIGVTVPTLLISLIGIYLIMTRVDKPAPQRAAR